MSECNERADFAVIGTWRDHKKIDQDEFRAFVEEKGRDYVMDNIITRCPTKSLALAEDGSLIADDSNCVRSMHCMNVVPKAIHPGDDKGVTILIGGKRSLKIGDLMGTVVVPFMNFKSEEDYEKIVELAEEIIDFWADMVWSTNAAVK